METAERIMWWGAATSFLVAAIALYGELSGWWNDAGEVAITVATILGALLAAIAILMNATRGQAALIVSGVTTNGFKLDTIFEATASNGRKLDTIVEATASNGRKLDTIVEATASNGRKLDKLDEGITTLHDDIGVLHEDMIDLRSSVERGFERQTDVLVQIRDRL